MNINYSYATLNDAYGITYVVAHSWKETYSGLVSDEYLNNKIINIPNKVENTKKIIKDLNGKYIVAKDNDKVIGILTVEKREEEKYKDYGLLGALYLLKEYQGYGIGKELLKIAVRELKNMGYSKMQLECMVGNKTLNFYKKYTGIVDSQIDFSLKNGETVKADVLLFEDLDEVERLLNKTNNIKK